MNTLVARRLGLGLSAAVLAAAALAAQPAVAAGSGHNLVRNGGFERQQAESSRPARWTAKGAANDFSGAAHSGTWHVDLVVGQGFPKVASVSQTVAIPASVTKATLTFWTEDWSCGDDIRFDAHVVAGGHDTVVKTIPGASCGTGYAKSSVSVKQFKGEKVTLRLGVTRISGNQFPLFYLDDVSLVVS